MAASVIHICLRRLPVAIARYSNSLIKIHSTNGITPESCVLGRLSSNDGRNLETWNNHEKKNILNKKHEKTSSNTISLILPSGRNRIVTLKTANQIAEKSNSELIEVRDEDRIVYRLVPREKAKQDKHKSETEKPENLKEKHKTIEIRTNISEHDLLIKYRKLVKMLENNYSIIMRIYAAESRGKISNFTQKQLLDILEKEVGDTGCIQEQGQSKKAFQLTITPKKTESAVPE